MSGSKLFQRNRALGYVSNHVPANVRYIRGRKENVITTCIGRLFHTYSCNHFRLICVSGLHPDNITCLAADHYCVYTASGKHVYAWRSGKILKHVYKGHEKNVHLLLPFGDHLISIDEDSTMKIWNTKLEEEYLELCFNNSEFRISAIMHPPTYLNKILLGSEQGTLQLWNIKGCKLIHTFRNFESKVMVLTAAPAVDVAAIGLFDGRIILLNLKFEEIIMEFKQDWGVVTGISFRTDGHPIMATSSANGNVAFWNLEEKKITSQLTAHDGSVTTTVCLTNEPLMFTSSPDNSMKLWIFDMPDGGARLLRIREGHSAPPLCIRYHDPNGHHILSSSEDSSFRIFNTQSETLNKSMGKASYNRKASKKKNRLEEDPFIMPPIFHFANETTREKEWDNIAAIHSGIVMTTTWSFNKCRMGDLKLIPSQFHNKRRTDFNTESTCVCLTHCGNFVIIGFSSGDVERFNIQSGIHRAKYGLPAHTASVRGVHCDNLNQYVVTGSSDGSVKFWHFKEHLTKPFKKITMDDGINMFRSQNESSMICIALENFSLNILDCDTKVVVRKFTGHTAQITDACFSPDGRWLISAAMDCTVKIWDIPSSYMIDHFQVENACISLTMSPTGDFLATAHVNYLGIFLWANKSLYNHITLRSINPESEAPIVDLTSLMKYDEVSLEDTMELLNLDEGEEIESNYKSPDQLDSELITMSDLPISRWQNLLSLDIIKQRNKPKVAPKVPKHAPFFLPTIAGLDFQFDLTDGKSEIETSKIHTSDLFTNLTKFGKLLDASVKTENYVNAFKHLMELGPSMIDFEIKSLHPDGGGTVKIMVQFLKMIEAQLNTNLYFELAQTYLAVFLKSHSKAILENDELSSCLSDVQVAQEKGWKIIEEKLLYSIGVVSNLRKY